MNSKSSILQLEGKPADAPDEEYQEHLENFTKQQVSISSPVE